MPASPSLSRFARRQAQLAKKMLPGTLAKFATSLGDRLAITGGQVEQVDERAMSARFVISTNGRDRDGDIMRPAGCRLDNYRKNPVVFYDHQQESGPVGMAENAGNLDLQVMPDKIISTCWFHGKNQISSETFALVAAKVLRMASIGFLPLNGERLPGKGHDFTEWELTEWSITPLGVNADALRLHLDAGRVKSMGLRRSLEPFAAKASKSAPKRGVTKMSEQVNGTVTKADPEEWDDEDDTDTETPPAAEETDPPVTEEPVGESEAMEEEAVTTDNAEAEPDHAMRHGAQALGTLAAINKAYAEQLTTMLAEHDNPNLRTLLEKLLADTNALTPQLEELLGKDYPGLTMESVMPSMDAAEEPELPEETVTKNKAVKVLTVKRLNKAHKSTITDAAEFLGEMGQEQKVPKSLQGSCRYHNKALTDLMSGMDRERDAEPEDEMPEEAMKALHLELRGVRKAVRA